MKETQLRRAQTRGNINATVGKCVRLGCNALYIYMEVIKYEENQLLGTFLIIGV